MAIQLNLQVLLIIRFHSCTDNTNRDSRFNRISIFMLHNNFLHNIESFIDILRAFSAGNCILQFNELLFVP